VNALLHGSISLGATRHVNVAFTLNPGYKKRTEVPEVMGVGPAVEMKVPDYHYIAEVMLAAEGIRSYTELARHATEFMQWCRESLTKQYHYDFGLRALKAVITAAGALSRKADEDADESAILATALWTSVMSGFTPGDAAMAEEQIRTMFPTAAPTTVSYLQQQPPTVQHAVRCVAAEDDAIRDKLARFIETTGLRHGVGVLTEEPRQVMQALSGVAPLIGVQMIYLGVQNRTCEQLLGSIDPADEWQDGSLMAALRMVAGNKDGPATWIVLDGSMDQATKESLNTVLDDNKRLCLESGEVIALRERTNVVFVVNSSDTAVMSPANVSRLGWVNFDTSAPRGWFW